MRLATLFLFLIGCMEYNPEPLTDLFNGVANPQDLEPEWVTDRHEQVEQPVVDILWIIDSSGSMVNEQAKLIDNHEPFIDHFVNSNTDYHVGVITTASPLLQEYLGERWVSKNTFDPYTSFSVMASVGIYGSGLERGRDQAYGALGVELAGYNLGFIRNEAPLYLIFISDEPDQSTTISKREFVEYLWGMKTSKDMITISSIIATPKSTCAYLPAPDYAKIAWVTGGIVYDICREDWADILRQLALVGVGIKTEFGLTHLPVPGTVSVNVELDNVVYVFEEDIDWEYDPISNSVKFLEFVPPKHSEVYITYMILASAEYDDIEQYADTGP